MISPGTVFGNRTVIGATSSRTKNRMILYEVECSCGDRSLVVGNRLKNTISCRKCSATQDRAKYRHDVVHSNYMAALERRAKDKSISVTVTLSDLEDKWKEQDGKCALTGRTLTLRTNNADSSATASVDRIDSNLGYQPDNIQWVHKHVNQAKNNLDESDFLRLCREVVDYKPETVKLRGR